MLEMLSGWIRLLIEFERLSAGAVVFEQQAVKEWECFLEESIVHGNGSVGF